MKTLSVNVTGDPGTTGFCNITFPTPLLGPPYLVRVDGALVTPVVATNATHTTLSVTYQHSEHLVEVIRTTVILEFPVVVTTLFGLLLLTSWLLSTTPWRWPHRDARTRFR